MQALAKRKTILGHLSQADSMALGKRKALCSGIGVHPLRRPHNSKHVCALQQNFNYIRQKPARKLTNIYVNQNVCNLQIFVEHPLT